MSCLLPVIWWMTVLGWAPCAGGATPCDCGTEMCNCGVVDTWSCCGADTCNGGADTWSCCCGCSWAVDTWSWEALAAAWSGVAGVSVAPPLPSLYTATLCDITRGL